MKPADFSTWGLLAVLALMHSMPVAEAAGTRQAAAKKKTAYGAIAWHRDSGSVGYSYDYATARLAGTEALRQCGHPRCEVVLALHNECGALVSNSQKFAARRGHTEAEAQTRAAAACGKDCRPVAWACTR